MKHKKLHKRFLFILQYYTPTPKLKSHNKASDEPIAYDIGYILMFFFHEISFFQIPSIKSKQISWLVGCRKIVRGPFVITIYNSYVHGTYQYFVDSFLSLPIQVILKLMQMEASKKILLPLNLIVNLSRKLDYPLLVNYR